MGFYQALSRYYDELFPASPQTCDFLERFLRPGGSALDVACGTGNYACALAQRGYRVVGVDLDAEMIKRALEKVSGSNPRFLKGDMLKVREILFESFDLVYCIGNSLPHLPDEEAVAWALHGFFSLTEPGGALVLQTVNFDRVFETGRTEFPPIERAGVRFERDYVPYPECGRVIFVGKITVSRGGRTRSATERIKLLAVKREELTALVEAAGFRRLEVFGDFKGSPWSGASPATVISAYRPEEGNS